jgi:hypothetical protein
MNRALILALLLAATTAQAQTQATTVWRCGADGRSYTDSACPGGQALQVADPRTAADQAEARAVVARDQRLARQMVLERREREHDLRLRGSGLTGVKPAEAVRPPSESEWLPRPLSKRKLTAGARTSRAADRGSRRRLG